MYNRKPLFISLFLAALVTAGAQDQPDPQQLVADVEDLMRADGVYNEMAMEIVTPDWKRTVEMRSWDDRDGDRSFIHITAPARDEDTTFLKLQRNLWSYIPRAERTIKVPPSMMNQSWMGSDFTYDNLMRESSYIEDFDHFYEGLEEVDGRQAHHVRMIPKPDAAITWGRIDIWIDRDRPIPLRYLFYNRRGEARKEMRMTDIKTLGGRELPTRWTMTTIGKEGHHTAIILQDVAFNPQFDDAIFTRRHLTNPARR